MTNNNVILSFRVKVNTLGSGTDHAPFAFYAGIPSINIEFIYDKVNFKIEFIFNSLFMDN